MRTDVLHRLRAARPADARALLDVWLRSVRATHAFLAEADIQALLPIVRDQALPALTITTLVDEADAPFGFVGVDGPRIEALFISPDHHRRGGGRALVDHVRAAHATVWVDVNEQNPDACGFYAKLGFVIEGRSPLDGQGCPFPLLHLRWDRPS